MILPLRRCSTARIWGLAFVLALVPATARSQTHTSLKASGPPAKSVSTSKSEPLITELRSLDLLFPVPGVVPDDLEDTFSQPRDGNRVHHALDIPAARGTPVLATDSGKILKLHESKAGGLMIYMAGEDGRFIYCYAHLDHYREGLSEGAALARGDTIGYVGTTGNAPPNLPHLHFQILRAKNLKHWSKGTAVDPYKVFVYSGTSPQF